MINLIPTIQRNSIVSSTKKETNFENSFSFNVETLIHSETDAPKQFKKQFDHGKIFVDLKSDIVDHLRTKELAVFHYLLVNQYTSEHLENNLKDGKYGASNTFDGMAKFFAKNNPKAVIHISRTSIAEIILRLKNKYHLIESRKMNESISKKTKMWYHINIEMIGEHRVILRQNGVKVHGETILKGVACNILNRPLTRAAKRRPKSVIFAKKADTKKDVFAKKADTASIYIDNTLKRVIPKKATPSLSPEYAEGPKNYRDIFYHFLGKEMFVDKGEIVTPENLDTTRHGHIRSNIDKKKWHYLPKAIRVKIIELESLYNEEIAKKRQKAEELQKYLESTTKEEREASKAKQGIIGWFDKAFKYAKENEAAGESFSFVCRELGGKVYTSSGQIVEARSGYLSCTGMAYG